MMKPCPCPVCTGEGYTAEEIEQDYRNARAHIAPDKPCFGCGEPLERDGVMDYTATFGAQGKAYHRACRPPDW